MSVMGDHEDQIRNDPPLLLYRSFVSQIAANIVLGMFVSELQMSAADNVTRHMSHDTGETCHEEKPVAGNRLKLH